MKTDIDAHSGNVTIQACDGVHYSLVHPVGMPLEVLAHSLARINRFNGHLSEDDYSVAEHSIHCAAAAKYDGCGLVTQLRCILHDAGEAYVGDIHRPLQFLLGTEMTAKLKAIEKRCLGAVYLSLGIGALFDPDDQQVKYYDNLMLFRERARMLPNTDEVWLGQEAYEERIKAEGKMMLLGCKPNEVASRWYYTVKALIFGVGSANGE